MNSHYSQKQQAQKDPSYLIDRLVSFVMHALPLQRQYNFPPHDILAMELE